MNRVLLAAMLCFGIVCRAYSGLCPLGAWWWSEAPDVQKDESKLAFLQTNGVTEVYRSFGSKASNEEIAAFVRQAGQRGIRVAWLVGDVSWIEPGNDGFYKALARFRRYQSSVKSSERFFAIHLDVEPQQNKVRTKQELWRLFGAFSERATTAAHRLGVKIEFDLPFWLDDFDASLLKDVMRRADGVVIMSYRDSAQAMLSVAAHELSFGEEMTCRVLLGALTDPSEESPRVTFYEEGCVVMQRELAAVKAELSRRPLCGRTGIAVHSVDSWMRLADRSNTTEGH